MKNNLYLLILAIFGINLPLFSKEISQPVKELYSIELTAENDSLALSKTQAANLSQRLINEPLKFLNEIKKQQESLANSNFHLDLSEDFLKNARNECPIFILNECDGSICGLSRCDNSCRELYEKTVIKYLKNYKNQERINFVSYACGGMFQDLVIFAQATTLHGIKNVNIHLIDEQFDVYTGALSKLNQKSLNTAEKFNKHFHSFSLIKEQTEEMQKLCANYLNGTHEKLRQFVSLLKVLSENNIKVYLHTDVESYYKSCVNNPAMQADIIAAIDFEIEFGYEQCVLGYYYLMYNTLKKGGVAILADNFLNKSRRLPLKDRIFKKSNNTFISVHTKKEVCSAKYLKNLEKKFSKKSNLTLSSLEDPKYLSYAPEPCTSFNKKKESSVNKTVRAIKNILRYLVNFTRRKK